MMAWHHKDGSTYKSIKKPRFSNQETDATFHPPFCFLHSIPCGGEESRHECFTPSTDWPGGKDKEEEEENHCDL